MKIYFGWVFFNIIRRWKTLNSLFLWFLILLNMYSNVPILIRHEDSNYRCRLKNKWFDNTAMINQSHQIKFFHACHMKNLIVVQNIFDVIRYEWFNIGVVLNETISYHSRWITSELIVFINNNIPPSIKKTTTSRNHLSIDTV